MTKSKTKVTEELLKKHDMDDLEIGLEGCEVPPGIYECKIIEDLGDSWLFVITKGEHRGRKFKGPKIRPPMLIIDGVRKNHYGETLH